MERLLKEICPENRWADFLERKDLDLAHEIPGVARFRGNFLYNHWGQAAVFRQIPAKILSFDELKLPEALKKLCHLDQGLVVVTGPTGSGKSTTLAAMIDYINDEPRAKHIITIEDPIEFVHPEQEMRDRAPRGRRAHRVVRRRAQGRHAPRPRHPPPRRNARDGDDQARARLRLDGHARLRHAAHQQRPEDRRPHHQHLSRRGAEPGARDARRLPRRRRRPAPLQAIPKGRCAVHEILLQHEALPNTIRSGQIANIRASSRAAAPTA
jgi:twitching motility protein PilT